MFSLISKTNNKRCEARHKILDIFGACWTFNFALPFYKGHIQIH